MTAMLAGMMIIVSMATVAVMSMPISISNVQHHRHHNHPPRGRRDDGDDDRQRPWERERAASGREHGGASKNKLEWLGSLQRWELLNCLLSLSDAADEV